MKTYKVLDFRGSSTKLEAVLNEYASEGWSVVGVTYVSNIWHIVMEKDRKAKAKNDS